MPTNLSYDTHKRWLDVVDKHHTDWQEGAMGRAREEFDKIPLIKYVDGLKIWAGVALVLGPISALVFLITSAWTPQPTPVATPTPAPVASPNISQVVNVNYPSTKPAEGK